MTVLKIPLSVNQNFDTHTERIDDEDNDLEKNYRLHYQNRNNEVRNFMKQYPKIQKDKAQSR